MEDYVKELEKESQVQEPGATPPRGKLLRILLVAALLVAVAAAWLWLHGRYRVSTDDAQVDGHIAMVSSKISGSVLAVLVEHNQHVKPGDVLVRIDPRDYQARVEQARAALALAESQARAARAGVPLTRETTASGTSGASAQVAQAEAEYNRARIAAEQAASSDVAKERAKLEAARAANERAQADLARMKPLAAKAEISRLQMDAYTAAARMAEAEFRAAEQAVAAAVQKAENSRAAEYAARARVEAARAALAGSRAGERQVQVSAAQASSAEAAVAQARANLEAAALQLSYTTILAPLDGVVTRKTVEAGQMLQPGQSFMAIVPLDDVWVTANFKETQLEDVHPGQKAEVKVDMYGRTIQGRVDSIAGATGARLSLLPPENATGNFVKVVQRIPVRIVFDSLPQGVVLRPGMNVNATILTK